MCVAADTSKFTFQMALTRKDIERAVARVENGESVIAVAKSSCMSLSTVSKYVCMMRKDGVITINKRGPKPLVPPEAEDDLVSWVAAMQRCGFPVDRDVIIRKAK